MKSIRKLMAIMMGTMLALSLAVGCGATPQGDSAETSKAAAEEAKPAEEAQKAYRIAYIARAQSDSFAAWLANAVKDEVAANYKDVTVDIFDGESKNEVIASHIENAVTNQYDAILLQPYDSEAQVAPAMEAMDAGVQVVTVNNRINDNDRAGAIDADPVEQAAKNAELAFEQIPQNGKVVVLMGPAGNMHSDKRRIGWQQAFFDKRPDVKILDEQIANWNKDEAMRFMEDWIQTYGEIDAIISMNDNMAVGALEAAKATGMNDILSYGVDGTAEACLAIEAGEMTSTTLQSAYALAEEAVKLTYKLMTGTGERETILVDCPLITKDNAQEYIDLHKKAGNLQ
ncbi:MAG: ABC-type sugar transport system, periplasmic component [Clostridia bacterium]|nr:ABC-type sugar transport system, periplasmic component [Clostridia bacterium]